jgi:thioredoxin reductase (NADPH)
MIHNTIIIGGGCAGYVAGYYAGRANLYPLLIEGSYDYNYTPGGQLTTTTEVENFPAFPDGIHGSEAIKRLRQQATKWGSQILKKSVTKCDFSSSPFKIFTNNDSVPLLTKSVIIATGANAKKIDILGGDIYWNRGISACATCDGALPIFRNKQICVIGGGDSAMEEALFLSKYGSKIYLLNRSQKFKASKVMIDKVKNNPKIEILLDSIIVEALGDNKKLNKIRIKNIVTQEEKYLEVSGLFFAIGHTPNSQIFKNIIDMDDDGYIKTVNKSTKTNINGVFACGDVQDKIYRQAVTAMGSGCMASIDMERYLESL